MTKKVVFLEDYKQPFIETRASWGGFPSVFSFAKLGSASNHPNYADSKNGRDAEAAIQLVEDIVKNDVFQQFLQWLGDLRDFKVVPVYAIEENGVNQIPLALAYTIASRVGVDLCLDIIQSSRAFRTNKGAYYRLVNFPEFDGDVVPGTKYLIVDDTLAMGGTIASLKGFIENGGGIVIGAAVLTSHLEQTNINITCNMFNALIKKHGEKLDEWWKSFVGFGLDKLTQGEAGHLKKAPDIDTIRERIAESQSEA
jgi:hypoxanthine-guanine phosphoribosyltransferase